MARIQQKKTGRRQKPRVEVNGHELREALRETMDRRGMKARNWRSGFGLNGNPGGKENPVTT